MDKIILKRAIKIFGDKDSAKQFMSRKHLMLEDKSPTEYLQQKNNGVQLINEILDIIEIEMKKS